MDKKRVAKMCLFEDYLEFLVDECMVILNRIIPKSEHTTSHCLVMCTHRPQNDIAYVNLLMA